MKNIVNHIIVVVSILITTSCVSTHQYSIEILQPAKKQFPSNVRNITLLAHNLKYKNDTVQKYYQKNHQFKRSNSKQNIDSLVVTNALKGFSHTIQKNYLLDSIYTLPYNTFKLKYVKRIPHLSWKQVERICQANQTDAVASLQTITYLNHLFVPGSYDDFRRTTEVISGSIWSVYDLKKRKIIDSKVLVDTLYWDGVDPKTKKRYALPNRVNALKDAGWYMGKAYAQRFTPDWKSVWRFIYIPNNPQFIKAKKLVEKEKWHEAVEIWLLLSKSPKPKFAFYATFNLALAAEMDGDIAKAKQIAQRAKTMAQKMGNSALLKASKKMIKIYSIRLNNIEKLKRTMNN